MNNQYQPGQVVMGNWTITKLLGKGSYGAVFEITRSDFGVDYFAALKVMTIPNNDSEIKMALEEGMNPDEVRQYFYTMVEEIVSEFALMSKLKGVTNVVSYEDHAVIPHESGIGWDILIRMELLTPLLSYAYQNPFARKDIIRLGTDMCRALELCQKYNIIHRDIKPDNIFVSANGDFKLGDFGIARTIEKTSSGLSKKGTYNYMAPEVYRGEEYGFSVDTYSLGIVLYRLLNKNRVPFMPEAPLPITYNDKESALAQRMRGVAMPMPFHNQGRLPEIILKSCDFNPKERYSSPQQMRQELEAIQYDSLEADLIYPSGDDLSIEKNLYIATGKTQDSPIARLNDSTDVVLDDHTILSLQNRQDNTAISDAKKPKRKKATAATTTGAGTAKKGNVALPIIAAVIVLVALGAGGLYFRNTQLEQQAQEAQAQQDITDYNSYMSQASELMTTDPTQAMEYLLLAQELQPENPDPFVNYGYALYLSRAYDECIDYIENTLALGKAYDVSYQSTLAEILGAAYFEQDDYAAAASFFRLCTAGGDLSASAMRDYAVSLGRLGDIDAAAEVLQTMFDAGATEMETTFVQAEIDYAQGNYLEAEAALREVLEQSDDTTLQARALRTLAELYRDCATLEYTGASPIENAAMKEAELLSAGIVSQGLSYDSTLWEMLAFAYFEAYNVTDGLDESWLIASADAFYTVINLGIQKEYLYTNLYTIYYQLGDYTAAETALQEYESVYPYAYTPHALRATMLIMLENKKEQLSRDYNDAYAEFLLAEDKLTSTDDTTYYQQVKTLVDTLFSQGWL